MSTYRQLLRLGATALVAVAGSLAIGSPSAEADPSTWIYASLTQDNIGGIVKAGDRTGRTQDIRHQRAAARSGLGQCEGVWCALVQPALRQAEADKLAEHLADFGCGDEITSTSDCSTSSSRSSV